MCNRRPEAPTYRELQEITHDPTASGLSFLFTHYAVDRCCVSQTSNRDLPVMTDSSEIRLHLAQVDRCLELAKNSQENDVKRTYLACAKVWLALAQEVQIGREFPRATAPLITAA